MVADTLTPWHCPGCGLELGQATAQGLLVVGPLLLERGVFRCAGCGACKTWNKSDKLLADLVDAVTGEREKDPASIAEAGPVGYVG